MSTEQASRRGALVAMCLAAFLTPFMVSAIYVANPTIGRQLDLSDTQTDWILLSFMLATVVTMVPMGRAADIVGRMRVFNWGMVLYVAASLLCAVAQWYWLLLVGRSLQGVGSAMIFGTCVPILISLYPPTARGMVLGWTISAVYLGLALGPTIGGFMTQHWGWRSIFYSSCILGVAILAFVTRAVRGDWADARGERFDWVGTLLFAPAMIALMLGLPILYLHTGQALAAAGLAGLVLFGWWELRSTSPLLDLRLFRGNPVFAFSNLAALINYSATAAVGYLISRYLQHPDLQALTPQAAGWVMLAQPAIMAICSPLAGHWSDRVGARLLASAGMGCSVVGLVLLTGLRPDTSITLVAGVMLLLGFGFGIFSSPNTNAVMSSVERRSYGVASATLGTMRLVGQLLSFALATFIMSLHGGAKHLSGPELLASMHQILWVFAGLCTLGIFASLARGKHRGPEPGPAGGGPSAKGGEPAARG